MEFDVTIDRNKYIGGSDIPVIMGISPFKTRYELLLEKSGLKENDFEGNAYTKYGQLLEPQIRAHINKPLKKKFEPNQVIQGDLRAHSDGFNGTCILEIKTTSHIFETLDEYKIYLVQMLFYMERNNVKKGKLAVYERPEDFDPEFDPERLHIYDFNIKAYKSLLEEINAEIERFRADLKRLHDNPLLSEEDFQPTDVVALTNKVIELENRMQEFKALESEYKEMKQALYEAMQKHDVKSWEMLNGTKITRVDGTEGKTEIVSEFDLEKFKADSPEVYKNYCREVKKQTRGRAGYVKITFPKE